MISLIKIRNFMIIESLEVDLQGAMTAITGETGSGKSIIIDALELALGKKADGQIVRGDATRCDITAHFEIAKLTDAVEWLENRNIPFDGECIITRTITSSGRSRTDINGISVTQEAMREFATHIVIVLGQHHAQSLLKYHSQDHLLDTFGGLEKTAQTVKQHYDRWFDAKTQLAKLEADNEARTNKRELLGYQVKELDELAIEPNEFEKTQQQHTKLASAQTLIDDAYACSELLEGDDGHSISKQLHDCKKLIEKNIGLDDHLKNCAKLLDDALIATDEATHEIKAFQDSMNVDPERLQTLDTRLSTIIQVARKHQVPEDALYDHHQTLANELAQIDTDDATLTALRASLAELEQAYLASAAKLTKARTKAAKQFSQAITDKFAGLGMPQGRFQVGVVPAQNPFSARGADKVVFEVQTNPGQPMESLAKIVSGGELSRINLAIQVTINPKEPRPTFICDEVDVGMGGQTAHLVGELLAQLAHSGQVLVVTHLPQVAAKASAHLHVEKYSKDKATYTIIKSLDEAARIDEIARMLGGANITSSSRAHAQELLGLTTEASVTS